MGGGQFGVCVDEAGVHAPADGVDLDRARGHLGVRADGDDLAVAKDDCRVLDHLARAHDDVGAEDGVELGDVLAQPVRRRGAASGVGRLRRREGGEEGEAGQRNQGNGGDAGKTHERAMVLIGGESESAKFDAQRSRIRFA